MTLAPLATLDDLVARAIPITDQTRATTALAAASAAVREAAGCPITVTTSTVTLYPECWGANDLPGGPVRSVGAVKVAGVNATAGSWAMLRGQLYAGRLNPVWPHGVDVTYTHGYDECPADIVELVCNLAALSMAQEPGEVHDPRVTSEAIDDSRTTWASGVDTTVSVMELPERTRQALARRFGGGVYVTGR